MRTMGLYLMIESARAARPAGSQDRHDGGVTGAPEPTVPGRTIRTATEGGADAPGSPAGASVGDLWADLLGSRRSPGRRIG